MFSRFLHSSAAFLFPYNALGESASSFQVDQQIQTELGRAAEQGMVSTRSQDNTPASGASQPPKLLYPQVVVHEKKRNCGKDGEECPAQAVAKRRRSSAKSIFDAASSSSASKPGRPRRRASAKSAIGDVAHATDLNELSLEPSTQGSRPNSPQTPGITTQQTIDDGKEEKAVEVAIEKPNDALRLNDEMSETHDQVNPYSGSATRPREGKIEKKRAKASDEIAGVGRNGTDINTLGKKPETSSAAAEATHKRFGSDDIDVLGTVPSTGIEERERIQGDLPEDEGESEDEAPETVTASAGFDKARTSALGAAKVAARYILSRLRLCSSRWKEAYCKQARSR